MTNNRSNKKRTFAIPKGFIAVFFDKLEDSGLDYELTEVDEDGDLCVEVEYTPSDREEVMDLVELEDEYYQSNPKNEENEQDEN